MTGSRPGATILRRSSSDPSCRNFEEQQKSFRELIISLVLALVLVYMVLACQYESLRDPLARAVVGGLTGSTLITLVLIPAAYSLFHADPKASRK